MKKAASGRGHQGGAPQYLGDAVLGAKVNIGAGTITCNYDGFRKQPDRPSGTRAFIGVNTALIAPVSVGPGAYVGTGTVLTRDVPATRWRSARAKQVTNG